MDTYGIILFFTGISGYCSSREQQLRRWETFFLLVCGLGMGLFVGAMIVNRAISGFGG